MTILPLFVPCFQNYSHYIVRLYSIEHNKTKKSFDMADFCLSNTVLYLLLAEQAPMSGHLSPTPLVFENCSRKPAPVSDTFSCVEGVGLLTRALTVSVIMYRQGMWKPTVN